MSSAKDVFIQMVIQTICAVKTSAMQIAEQSKNACPMWKKNTQK